MQELKEMNKLTTAIIDPNKLSKYRSIEEWKNKDIVELSVRHAPKQVRETVEARLKNPASIQNLPKRYKELITEIDFAFRDWTAYRKS